MVRRSARGRPADPRLDPLRGAAALAAAGVVAALSACAPTIVTPGPPEEITRPAPGADGTPPRAGDADTAPSRDAPAPAPGPAPGAFASIADSDAWVRATFQLQSRYARVLVVAASGDKPARIRVAAPSLESGGAPGSPRPADAPRPAEEEVAVERHFTSIQPAIDAAEGGDLVAVLPGRYAGFVVGDKPSAKDGAYLHVRAVGAPGSVVIEAPSFERAWMVDLKSAHHVVVQGLEVAGGGASAGPARAGIMLDGDFGRSSKLTHHVAVVECFAHDHAMWGLHATDTHSVLVQDSVFTGSRREHGVYVSDGSDNWVVRRNVFQGNNASGLQINLDPIASLQATLENPALSSSSPGGRTRAWAKGIVDRATDKFGARGFPDGKGENILVEANVATGNGRAGGGAFNFAAFQDSVVQDNLAYANAASGIVLWDNANPYDEAFVTPGPQTAEDVTGADALPLWGSHGTTVRHNTVIGGVAGRPALLVGSGSWGARVYNNVLLNDARPALELHGTALWRFESGRCVVGDVDWERAPAALRTLMKNAPTANGTVTNVTRTKLYRELVAPGDAPWVIVGPTWWRPNPARPDFRPRASASLLAGRGDPAHKSPRDLSGRPRHGADVGAYAP